MSGESVDELHAAWATSAESLNDLVLGLTTPAAQPAISHETLVEGQLTGDVGRLKRSTLSRLRDLFIAFWNSEPRTAEKREDAADAASDYLEVSTNVVSSIPGWEKVEELLSLTKQLIDIRKKRDARL